MNTCHKLLIAYILLFAGMLFPQNMEDNLKINYSGDAQAEAGNFYTGLEFHHNSPIIQRISFYYPVANSVDLSNDYWKRDSSFVMAAAIKQGGKTEWLNHQKFTFTSTPYSISFYDKDEEKEVRITYNFMMNKPAYSVTYEITNLKKDAAEFELYTDLEANLKTSHSYKIKDKAWSSKDNSGIYINYNDRETGSVTLFTVNAGEQPGIFSTKSVLNKIPVENNEWWSSANILLNNELIEKNNLQTPAFRFLYKKILKPGETLKVVQVTGTGKFNEAKETAKYLKDNYLQEINDYKNYVLNYIKDNSFVTGDDYLDKSVLWSNGILAVNKHYIDNSIQPMPCPAEYYFHFTHDVLLTDLAAVNFDLKRVKSDLSFIISNAGKDSVIPHAFYWQDTAFVTEPADPDNWNHFWFIITSAKYLLHSGDKEFMEKLYPYITKSLSYALQNRKDSLMWAIRPDWWDIGRNYGPRAYTTILTYKALQEFIYISAQLDKNSSKLKEYEDITQEIKAGLNKKLWNDNQKYLLNYFADGSLDEHYYIGSLLASHYNLLDEDKINELNKTAEEKLLEKNTGIYTVYPMDFNKLIDYLKFQGMEMGEPYYYINGGIWSQGNAWYALSLMKAGHKDKAYDFIRRLMSINGIMDGPHGQPAMYEVRYGNPDDTATYGKIDKPQFMWYAGWYMHSLYNLFGIKESNWNVCFDPYLKEGQDSCTFNITISGKKVPVKIEGAGENVQSITYGGTVVPSLVVPADINEIDNINIIKGDVKSPYIKSLDGRLISCNYDKEEKKLTAVVSSFEGHNNTLEVISPYKPLNVYIDNLSINKIDVAEKNGVYIIKIPFLQKDKDSIEIEF